MDVVEAGLAMVETEMSVSVVSEEVAVRPPSLQRTWQEKHFPCFVD